MSCVVIVINRIIQKYTRTAAVIARSAERDAAISRKGRLTCIYGQNTRRRWLTAEKSHAAKTARYVHAPAKCPHGFRAAPAHLPAVAHRREIPHGRNGTPRTSAGPLARTGSVPRRPTRRQGLPAVLPQQF